jgi:2-succinyl-6-hydroxy-2,4-cyclohexadiene-1-carboxylate synthase
MSSHLSFRYRPGSSDEVVLYLHGFLGQGSDWDAVSGFLGDRFGALLVDLPGHGGSESVDAGYWSFDGLTDSLALLVEDVAPSSLSVVGYSMGGRIAQYLVRRHPAIARHLAVVSATPGYVDDRDRELRLEADKRLARDLISHGTADFVLSWYENPLFASFRQCPVFDETIRERSSRAAEPLARALEVFSVGNQPPMWNALEEVSFPTLFVAGAFDGKFVDIARRAALCSESVRDAIIAGAGHCLHLERPKVLADVLREFLETPI